MSLRRTLEMSCIDKGAIGRTLYDKLEDLSQKGILPLILNSIAYLLREEGNDAAHGEDKEINDYMVKTLFDFTETLLEYLYVIPTRLAEIQQEKDEAKA